jgi:hypothetical protein
MKLSEIRSSAAWLCGVALVATASWARSPVEEPAAETAQRGRVVYKTVLFGLAPNEALVLRALDAGRGGAASQLQVVFLSEANEVVRREVQSFAPGKPATFRVLRSDLGTDGEFPAVRAEMVLTQGGAGSEVFLNVEFHDTALLRIERGPVCTPPRGSSIQPDCSGGGLAASLEQ